MSKNHMRNSLRSKLSSSLKEEEKKVQSRFETADTLLLRTPSAALKTEETVDTGKQKTSSAIEQFLPLQKKAKIRAVTFNMLAEEDEQLDSLVLQAARAGRLVNRSQVLRAGIAALSKINPEDFISFIESVKELKPGRSNS